LKRLQGSVFVENSTTIKTAFRAFIAENKKAV